MSHSDQEACDTVEVLFGRYLIMFDPLFPTSYSPALSPIDFVPALAPQKISVRTSHFPREERHAENFDTLAPLTDDRLL